MAADAYGRMIARVYGLVDPRSGVIVYGGATTATYTSRLSTHIWNAKNGKANPDLKNWLSQLAKEGLRPSMVEVWEGDLDDVDAREQAYIAELRATQPINLNKTKGGGVKGLASTGRRHLDKLCEPFKDTYDRYDISLEEIAMKIGAAVSTVRGIWNRNNWPIHHKQVKARRRIKARLAAAAAKREAKEKRNEAIRQWRTEGASYNQLKKRIALELGETMPISTIVKLARGQRGFGLPNQAGN